MTTNIAKKMLEVTIGAEAMETLSENFAQLPVTCSLLC